LHFEVRTTFLGAADRRRGRIRTALTIAQLAKCNCRSKLVGDGVSTALAFRLEHGAAILGRVFSTVTLARYDDALLVTEATPLIAYARSMHEASGRDFAALERAIARRLAANGAIHSAEETGLFRAE